MTEREARDQEPVTINDKRKINAETGTVRSPEAEHDSANPAAAPSGAAGGAATSDATVNQSSDTPDEVADAPASSGVSDEVVRLNAQLDERTADLKRVQAEFANYKRRVARDQQVAADAAKAKVMSELLTVLDDLDRARAHGDLESGPLKSVADKLQSVLTAQGLEPFGAEGEAFDPSLHEAVQHEGDGSDPVIGMVLRPGYTLGDRVLRHAMVSVVDRPASPDEQKTPEETTVDADAAAAESE